MTTQILRFDGATAKLNASRSAIYDWLNPKSPRHDPTFPRPVRIGARAVGFLEHELDAWLADRASQRGAV